MAALFGSLAKCFTDMQKICQDHSEGKAPKLKAADASATKRQSKASAKEEAKQAKQENT
jgi:hypothetical protein